MRGLAVAKRLTPLTVRRRVRRLWEPWGFWDALRTLGITTLMPPSEAFKRRVIKKHAPGCETFVETGTFRGDTVEAVRRRFRAIWSIELGHDLAIAAQRRFARWPHITIIEGDSGEQLPTILLRIHGPCLFWLDAHWNGNEVTARGNHPLVAELRAVLDRRERDVILIDDVRMFGTGDYPSFDTIESLVTQASTPRVLRVKDDIARITPV